MTMSAPSPKRTADTLLTAQRAITLPAHLAEAVKQFSHREGGTLFIALVAALKTLLCRSFGETDLCVATNVANRNKAGTEGLIGPLANTVILRTDLGGDPTVREVMRRVRATTLGAYAQQDLPFEDLAEILKQERGVELPDLAQVMILLHNASLRPLSNSAQTFAYEDANPDMPQPLVTTTTYNVILALRETEGGLVGSCLYKSHLFSAKSIDRLLYDFRTVLENMVAQPERSISAIDIHRKTSAELLPT
jgi:non-ribosomal peptide synthetase component F